MPKKVVINLVLLVLFFASLFVLAHQAPGAWKTTLTWATSALVITWLSVFITALAGFGPIGTTPKWSVKKSLTIAAALLVVGGLLFGGFFAATGAVLGTGLTLLYYRGAL